jgi:hypothetical protein
VIKLRRRSRRAQHFIVENLRHWSISRLVPSKFVHQTTIQIRVKKDIIPTWMRMTGSKGFKKSISNFSIQKITIPEDQRLISPFQVSIFPGGRVFLLARHPLLSSRIPNPCCPLGSQSTLLVDVSLFFVQKWPRGHDIDVFCYASRWTSPRILPGLS